MGRGCENAVPGTPKAGMARGSGNADLWSAQRPAGPRRRRPQPSGWFPSRRVPLKGRMARDSGPPPGELATGLRPASRGSAKPAAMTPGPANVSAAPPFHAGGVCRRARSCGFVPVGPGAAVRRRAEPRIANPRQARATAGESLALHPPGPPSPRPKGRPPPSTAPLPSPLPPRSPPQFASAMPRSGGGGPWWGRPASPAGHRPR